jgi:hypothetical protein
MYYLQLDVLCQHLVLVYCDQLILIQGFHDNNNITSVCLYVGKITIEHKYLMNVLECCLTTFQCQVY